VLVNVRDSTADILERWTLAKALADRTAAAGRKKPRGKAAA
jgi:hypothetical protein